MTGFQTVLEHANTRAHSLLRYIPRNQLIDDLLPHDPITPILHTLDPRALPLTLHLPIEVFRPTRPAEPVPTAQGQGLRLGLILRIIDAADRALECERCRRGGDGAGASGGGEGVPDRSDGMSGRRRR